MTIIRKISKLYSYCVEHCRLGRKAGIPPIQEEDWRFRGALLLRGLVGKQDNRQSLIPLFPSSIHSLSKHRCQGPVKPLHKTICLRMIGSGVQFLVAQELLNFFE